MDPADSAEPEVGRGSLLLLRMCAIGVVVVLAWFLVDAVIG